VDAYKSIVAQGKQLLGQGHYQEAMQTFDSALAVFPRSSEARELNRRLNWRFTKKPAML